jgi:MFS family permease
LFATLLALGILNHTTITGARVGVALDALDRGASPATVGTLIALFALLPMLFAVGVGRLSDRAGARMPMVAGSAALVAATALPALFPGYPALFVAAPAIGSSCSGPLAAASPEPGLNAFARISARPTWTSTRASRPSRAWRSGRPRRATSR